MNKTKSYDDRIHAKSCPYSPVQWRVTWEPDQEKCSKIQRHGEIADDFVTPVLSAIAENFHSGSLDSVTRDVFQFLAWRMVEYGLPSDSVAELAREAAKACEDAQSKAEHDQIASDDNKPIAETAPQETQDVKIDEPEVTQKLVRDPKRGLLVRDFIALAEKAAAKFLEERGRIWADVEAMQEIDAEMYVVFDQKPIGRISIDIGTGATPRGFLIAQISIAPFRSRITEILSMDIKNGKAEYRGWDNKFGEKAKKFNSNHIEGFLEA